MSAARSIELSDGGVQLHGLLLTGDRSIDHGTVLLVHDAFGLTGFSLDAAHRLVDEGFTVVAVDMWGRLLESEAEIGPLIAEMVTDRGAWVRRVRAWYDLAAAQTEVDAARIAALGYCFGGSTALELVRSGAALRGAGAVHAGLDLLDPTEQWAPAETDRVLLCAGAEDPMSTPAQWRALRENLDAAGIHWELDLYARTVHAFTNPALSDPPHPDIAAYQPLSARRAWESTVRFLADVLATTDPENEKES